VVITLLSSSPLICIIPHLNLTYEKELPVKKTLAVLVFTLVAACIVTPKIIAPTYQEKMADIVSNINNAPGYSAKIVSTNAAWFGAENKVLVSFDTAQIDPALQGEKLEAELVIETHYGPLLFSRNGVFGLYETDIRFVGETLRNELSWDESQPLYQLSVLGGFTGNFKLADTIPALSNPTNTFTFSGYAGKGEMNDKEFIYEGVLNQIDVDDTYSPTKAEGLTVSVELNADLETIMKGGFYDSMMDLSLDKLTLGMGTELSGITIGLSSALDRDTQLGSLEIGYFIKEVAYEGFTVSDLALVTELDNLSNKFFLDYKNFSDSLLAETNSPDSIYGALFVFMQDNIDELLTAKPEFNITDFSGTFSEGSFSASLTSKLADISTPTIDELTIPEFWLYNAIVAANIEADEALVRSLAERFIADKMRAPVTAPEVKQQAQIIIDGLIQQGLMMLENDKYLSEITIEEGQGKIYEMAFPLM
jgi:hypothetical protein